VRVDPIRGYPRLVMAALALAAVCGCGLVTLERENFPATAVGAEGERFFYDDIQEIQNDTTLSTEQRREALRDLGIEDEDLLDALTQ
jgi:hypothetical protein